MREFVVTEYVTGFYEYKLDITEKLVDEMNKYYATLKWAKNYTPLTLEEVELILDEEYNYKENEKEYPRETVYMVIDYIREEALNLDAKFEWTNTEDLECELHEEE